MMSFKKIVIFCDMWKHANLRTLGRFVWNRHTFINSAVSDVSCRFGESMPIPYKQPRVHHSASFHISQKITIFLNDVIFNWPQLVVTAL